MKQLLLALLFCIVTVSNAQITANTRAYFSPKGGVTDTIVARINISKKTIYVQAYSFTSKPIVQALRAAYKRGVGVQVILDESNRWAKSVVDSLLLDHIPTFIDSIHGIAHNKIMIIDSIEVITGSFNFSAAAEYSNAENVVIIRAYAFAKLYRDNWYLHRAHSKEW